MALLQGSDVHLVLSGNIICRPALIPREDLFEEDDKNHPKSRTPFLIAYLSKIVNKKTLRLRKRDCGFRI